MGGKWRIGDGSSTRIYKDAWLPGLTTGRILSVPSVLSENAAVNALFNVESGRGMLNLLMKSSYLLKLR